MPVGRKRTPTHLRLLQGNPGKRPIRDEPQPLAPAAAPEPPPFLDAYATEEWVRLAAELHRLRLLTVVDLAVLGAYCTSYSRWRHAEEALKRMSEADPVMHGLIIKSNKTNSAIENPLAYIARKAAQEMLRFAIEFGFTPAARSRIAAGVGAPPMPTKFGDLLA
jgi:P27 family predicted phage terminase small subunit